MRLACNVDPNDPEDQRILEAIGYFDARADPSLFTEDYLRKHLNNAVADFESNDAAQEWRDSFVAPPIERPPEAP